jgi:HSP20 family protein
MFTRINDIERLFGTMDLLRRKLEDGYPNYGKPLGYNWTMEESFPRTNLYENGDCFEVRAEVPGIKKEDLKVKVQGNYLEISGSRISDVPEGYKAHKTERDSESFSRSFTLPAEVDTRKVEATLKNGILFLTLPKSEAAKPKKINIS